MKSVLISQIGLCISLLICACCISPILAFSVPGKIINTSPIIGILAHPVIPVKEGFPNRQHLAASYVKWIESAGGRVVPVPYTITRDQAYELFSKLNGFLVPGGDIEYGPVASMLLDVAIDINRKGHFFPIWATCLGFEWVALHFSKDNDILKPTDSRDMSIALDFTPHSSKSSSAWLDMMPVKVKDTLSDPKKGATVNNHSWGVYIDDWSNPTGNAEHWTNQFILISTNKDNNDVEFVSTVEHRTLPLVGVQWHPEKNQFEFGVNSHDGSPRRSTVHSYDTIEAAHYSASFFVEMARMSPGEFKDWKELQAALIYNYPKVRSGPGFVEEYIFDFWPSLF